MMMMMMMMMMHDDDDDDDDVHINIWNIAFAPSALFS